MGWDLDILVKWPDDPTGRTYVAVSRTSPKEHSNVSADCRLFPSLGDECFPSRTLRERLAPRSFPRLLLVSTYMYIPLPSQQGTYTSAFITSNKYANTNGEWGKKVQTTHRPLLLDPFLPLPRHDPTRNHVHSLPGSQPTRLGRLPEQTLSQLRHRPRLSPMGRRRALSRRVWIDRRANSYYDA